MTPARPGLGARDRELQSRWRRRFEKLPAPARDALRDAQLALRADALDRAQASWARHKAPMALYCKVVGVYAGHLARALRPQRPAASRTPPSAHAAHAKDAEAMPRGLLSARCALPDARAATDLADPAP